MTTSIAQYMKVHTSIIMSTSWLRTFLTSDCEEVGTYLKFFCCTVHGREYVLCSVLTQAKGANVSGMVGYGDAEPFPLRWGEVIPLHFLLPKLPASTRTLILSQPNRRYTHSVEMIPELLSLGEAS